MVRFDLVQEPTQTLRRAVVAVAAVSVLLLSFAGVSDAAVDLSRLKVGDSIKVILDSGGSLEGSILAVEENRVRIKHKFGSAWVNRTDIKSLEKVKTPDEIYRERAQQCKTADDWYKLGRSMEKLNEFDLAERAWEEAVKVDPDHAETREARDEMQHEGEWLPKEKAYKAKGWKKYKGDWYPEEEYNKKVKEEADKYRDLKSASTDQLRKEYAGIPYAHVDPVITEHYKIWCTSTPEVGKKYGRYMEAMYDRYDSVFKNFDKYNKGKKAELTIHCNKQQFMDWYGTSPGVGGFYQPWDGNVFAYHGSFGTTGSTYEVLAHEGTHQFEGFIMKDFRACPMWVIEGMAVFFGDGSEYDERKNKVEIGIIPRDRLVTLQRMIESGAGYPRMNQLMLVGQPFPGALYAPSWGIVYWCLWGDRAPVKAYKKKGMGLEIFADFFEPITKTEGVCDYRGEMNRFFQLLENETGKDIGQWEEDYKDWIMKLPLEKLMKKKSGGRFVSEKLGFEVRKPSGWKPDKDLRRNEQIAFLQAGKAYRRIASAVWGNFDRAPLDEDLATRIIGSIYPGADYEADDQCFVATKKVVGGIDAVEAVFYGPKPTFAENSTGAQSSEASDVETVKVRFVIYATVDKVRTNVFESVPDAKWAQANEKFTSYLEDFKRDN